MAPMPAALRKDSHRMARSSGPPSKARRTSHAPEHPGSIVRNPKPSGRTGRLAPPAHARQPGWYVT